MQGSRSRLRRKSKAVLMVTLLLPPSLSLACQRSLWTPKSGQLQVLPHALCPVLIRRVGGAPSQELQMSCMRAHRWGPLLPSHLLLLLCHRRWMTMGGAGPALLVQKRQECKLDTPRQRAEALWRLSPQRRTSTIAGLHRMHLHLWSWQALSLKVRLRLPQLCLNWRMACRFFSVHHPSARSKCPCNQHIQTRRTNRWLKQ